MQPKHNKAEPVVLNKSSLPYGTRTLDPPITMVDRAREIESAEASIQSHVNGKLEVILEQIRHLKQQAREIIEQSHSDITLHKVKCNFEKKVGMIIHLYEKSENASLNEQYFSMLSPGEWKNPPHRFLGSYQIQMDQSFKKIDSK